MQNKSDTKKTIALFGGSFDPVHNGHLEIVRAFLKSEKVDELWVMPTPVPPFKSDRKLTSYTHRVEMATLAFEGMNQVKVSDYESQFIGITYTYRTLFKLKEDFPTYSWFLCIGGDNFAAFEKWYNYKEILNWAGLLVASRPDADYSELPEIIKKKAFIVAHDPVDISSTQTRSELNRGLRPKHLPKSVLSYIKKNKLYQG